MPRRVSTAATKGAELIKRLNSIALGAEVDDLVLRRIDLEARRMMTTDPVEANTVLGAVASLEGRAGRCSEALRDRIAAVRELRRGLLQLLECPSESRGDDRVVRDGKAGISACPGRSRRAQVRDRGRSPGRALSRSQCLSGSTRQG